MRLQSILLAALLLTASTPMTTAQASGGDSEPPLDDYPCGVIVVDFVYPYVWVSQSCLQDWVYYIEDKVTWEGKVALLLP